MENILKSLLFDLLNLLNQERDLLQKQSAERKETALKHQTFPAQIIEYLAEVKEDVLMQDIADLTKQINNLSEKTSENGLLVKLKNYLITDFSNCLDAKKQIELNGRLASELNSLLNNYSAQEISDLVNGFLNQFKETPFVVVQSPRTVNVELKKQIRDQFNKNLGDSFVNFAINKNLIGGLRVFVDGETQDLSWLSKINTITNIK